MLGEPELQVEERCLTFACASVQVHLGRTGVEFHTNPHTDGVEVELNGKNLSQLGVADCTEYLRACNKLAPVDDSEAPAAWVFEGIGLTTWQPYAFEDAQDDLDLATQAGEIAPEELRYLRDEVARANPAPVCGFLFPAIRILAAKTSLRAENRPETAVLQPGNKTPS
ncbi:hypothetical protein [uncultured Gulosibacter sp.]|uniref:hypothetical protein n=1 Tax=uncultured Gulosibacter sp. TaxID=1339167 RepID=UPI00288910AF|nr:hypothetical protein [uncultured Gulosibacter sp.]